VTQPDTPAEFVAKRRPISCIEALISLALPTPQAPLSTNWLSIAQCQRQQWRHAQFLCSNLRFFNSSCRQSDSLYSRDGSSFRAHILIRRINLDRLPSQFGSGDSGRAGFSSQEPPTSPRVCGRSCQFANDAQEIISWLCAHRRLCVMRTLVLTTIKGPAFNFGQRPKRTKHLDETR
jgi:hypothetical protein